MTTPKEKAKELIELFFNVIPGSENFYKEPETNEWDTAKKCAIICVQQLKKHSSKIKDNEFLTATEIAIKEL